MTDELTYLKMPKNAETLTCEKCDFNTSKQSNYTKHLLTSKHTNATKCYINAIQKEQKNAKCPFCEKKFIHSSSMYRHKNICKNNKNAWNYYFESMNQFSLDIVYKSKNV